MPISKEMAGRYPADWHLRRRFIIQYRADNRCEWCHAVNGEPDPLTGAQVSLTLAHVWDKRPERASLLNLAALCARCHNRWDAADRLDNRRRRRLVEALLAGQLPLPIIDSLALDLYWMLVETGDLKPIPFQLPIPQRAYELIA